ncbi:MAG: hypothetical protein LBL26_08165 [Peptococcaceae bacterium]|jgi:hypothetical protein|nr:hypothetical protein [Peptococcaceae bacterium]
METKLKITEFIHEHREWEARLAEAPYFIRTKRDEPYVLLKYEQYASDFTNPLVRECRGVILDEENGYRPVCVPFFKFGNYGESYVPDIDWATARVQEKIDGSLIKLWYDRGAWRTSTNSTVNAKNAASQNAYSEELTGITFYDLFWEAWENANGRLDRLDKGCTYLFELTSPRNRVIIRYEETGIWHIGTRDNQTLKEFETDIGIRKPKEYPLRDLADVVAAAEKLSGDGEGFVVVDGHYSRVKVKSPRYVMLAHLLSGVSTEKNILSLILKGETEEFITYFPEYANDIDQMNRRFDSLVGELEKEAAALRDLKFDSRKDMAAVVTKMKYPAFLFAVSDGKVASAREWLTTRPEEKVIAMLSAV